MNDTIFREYDIRGKVDQELILHEVYDLACAIAYYFKEKCPAIRIIALGMDGRIHSPAIKEEICRAFIDSGIDILFIGTCSSPILYFALHTQKVDGGLMITASHNGKEYNGIKVCLGTESVWGKELQLIKQYFKNKKRITCKKAGKVRNRALIPLYLDWLTDHFASLKGFDLPIVIDCGNGTAGTVLPALIIKMKWQNISLLYENVDGTYPNHPADPTVAENMKDVKTILETTTTAFGIGLDGDCDRMVVMARLYPYSSKSSHDSPSHTTRPFDTLRANGTGEITLIPGDQLLSVFAQQVIQEHPGAGVVFDIKSSSGLVELLSLWQAQPIISPSGHSIIKDMMRSHRALLGGELSCHFFFKDRSFGYDDGIYAMLRFFEIVHQTKKSPAELISIFPHKYSSPEFRLACAEEQKNAIVNTLKLYFSTQKDGRVMTLDGIRVTFPFGWGIVRASNTQAALSMRFESDSKEGLTRVMNRFETVLMQELPETVLVPLRQYKESW